MLPPQQQYQVVTVVVITRRAPQVIKNITKDYVRQARTSTMWIPIQRNGIIQKAKGAEAAAEAIAAAKAEAGLKLAFSYTASKRSSENLTQYRAKRLWRKWKMPTADSTPASPKPTPTKEDMCVISSKKSSN